MPEYMIAKSKRNGIISVFMLETYSGQVTKH
uniref:Uncharacterized protein n=1 Tax=Anguilla anguilla TaxID=7936 RepID=A0A0E9SNX5_ANGAN